MFMGISIINSLNLETIQMSIHKKMDKQIVV